MATGPLRDDRRAQELARRMLLDRFHQHDSNGDGILSADEVRDDDGVGIVRNFDLVDLDGNGHVTEQEWRRALARLDVNRDGSLTEDELWTRGSDPVVTRTFQAGRDRGLLDGRQAGREDRTRRGVWDLEGQRELEQADAGYQRELGAREEYQAGYRDGFRQGSPRGTVNAANRQLTLEWRRVYKYPHGAPVSVSSQ